MSQRILLELAYEGTAFSGFAPQENASTIGGVLEEALGAIDPHKGRLTCASRTDAGVHACHQIVSFITQKDNIEPRGWVLALQRLLPASIAVTAAGGVPSDFDPRRDPLWKRYRYRILQSPIRDPFLEGRAWRVVRQLDLSAMQSEAACLVGQHDFAAFRSSRDARLSSVRRIDEASVQPGAGDPRCLDIVVRGDRFLHNMVRIIAGSLVDVGRGRKAPGCIGRALRSGFRRDLGMTAPAHGLYLEHVELKTPVQGRWPARRPSEVLGSSCQERPHAAGRSHE